MLSKSLIVSMVGTNAITWMRDVNWGAAATGVTLFVGSVSIGLIMIFVQSRKRLTESRIENEAMLVRARIENERIESEARIAALAAYDRAYASSPKSRIDALTAQVAEQNESLVRARKTLHKINGERQAEQNRRFEEQQVLTQQLKVLAGEAHDLRDQNRELTRRIAELTAATNRSVNAVETMSVQVGKNAAAIAGLTPECPPETPTTREEDA